MRDETVSRITNSRYHGNPSSDGVFFRRRSNDSTFPWRACLLANAFGVAHYWGEGGNESRQRSEMSDEGDAVRTARSLGEGLESAASSPVRWPFSESRSRSPHHVVCH